MTRVAKVLRRQRVWRRAMQEMSKLPDGLLGDIGARGDQQRALRRSAGCRVRELRAARAAGLAR